ncbi:MAG: hypothetical protein RLZ10_716 [Bacteroidota bacterium]|jgi:hypothetical protein
MIIELKSVGCVIDDETLITYPQYQNGGYDDEFPIHLDEVAEGWFMSLDDNDFGTIKSLINNRKL